MSGVLRLPAESYFRAAQVRLSHFRAGPAYVYVALCRPLPEAIVTWFVTGLRTSVYYAEPPDAIRIDDRIPSAGVDGHVIASAAARLLL